VCAGEGRHCFSASSLKTSEKLFKIFLITDITMMRKKYPSDISREQFEQIAPLLEGLKLRPSERRQS
jgi:hypothetical protein